MLDLVVCSALLYPALLDHSGVFESLQLIQRSRYHTMEKIGHGKGARGRRIKSWMCFSDLLAWWIEGTQHSMICGWVGRRVVLLYRINTMRANADMILLSCAACHYRPILDFS